MKRCPKCQKEFPDSMRFCQTDGTSLVEDAAPLADPFKTIVGGQPPAGSGGAQDPFKTAVGGAAAADASRAKDDDILQLPEDKPQSFGGADDPMKTMVVSPEDWKREESSTPVGSSFDNPPAAKNFDEPNLSPPAFGDLSPSTPPSSAANWGDASGSVGSGSSSSGGEYKPFDSPQDSPFAQPPTGSPFGSPFEQRPPSPFDRPAQPQQQSSPFDSPPSPSFKEPDSPFGSGGAQSSPFDNSPFSSPASPFGGNQPASDPFGGASPQADWTPPAAPMQSWQDQGLGANTPFQPPAVGAGGQNQTLAIVSLVCGVLSICLCGLLTGIPAIITGYMAKNNIDANPGEYGGRGMAMAGMILGSISVVFSILYIIFVIFTAAAR